MRNNARKMTPMRWMLRRHLFLPVIIFLMSFAIFPMQGMVQVLAVSRWLEAAKAPISISLRNEYLQRLTLGYVYSPLNLEALCVLFGGMGFSCAMVLFRHLFSRKRAMMYAALPVRREKDFLLRSGVFALYALLPMALCLMVHPMMIRAYGLWELFNLRAYMLRAADTLLIMLYGYALGTLCCSLFGTIWSTVLGGLLLAGSTELMRICWTQFAGYYLNTLYVREGLSDMLQLSPVYTMYKAFYNPESFSLWTGIVATVVLAVLAYLAYRGTRPEHAGQTLNLKALEPVLLVWTALLGGTAGAYVLNMYMGREIILYIGLALGAAAVWILVRMLLDQRVRLNLKGWFIPAGAAALMMLVCLGMRLDITGFNTYAPKVEELRSIRVWPYQMDEEEMTFETPEEMEACLTWVGRMREEALAARQEYPFLGRYEQVAVFFEGKNGRTVSRSYQFPQNRTGLEDALDVMARSTEARRAENIRIMPNANIYASLESFGIGTEKFMELYGFTLSADALDRVDPEKLEETLRLDLAEHTLETLQEASLLRIRFTGVDPETGEYEYGRESYSVHPSDQRTLDLILGAQAEKWVDYAEGGFAKTDEVIVFLCRYDVSGEEHELISYRRAESEEEVRDWMSRVIRCDNSYFRAPADGQYLIKAYSLTSLRNGVKYGQYDYDLEDPEFLSQLPEIEDLWPYTWYVMDSKTEGL